MKNKKITKEISTTASAPPVTIPQAFTKKNKIDDEYYDEQVEEILENVDSVEMSPKIYINTQLALINKDIFTLEKNMNKLLKYKRENNLAGESFWGVTKDKVKKICDRLSKLNISSKSLYN